MFSLVLTQSNRLTWTRVKCVLSLEKIVFKEQKDLKNTRGSIKAAPEARVINHVTRASKKVLHKIRLRFFSTGLTFASSPRQISQCPPPKTQRRIKNYKTDNFKSTEKRSFFHPTNINQKLWDRQQNLSKYTIQIFLWISQFIDSGKLPNFVALCNHTRNYYQTSN